MITLYKITFPTQNGTRVCPLNTSNYLDTEMYTPLREWLENNYSNFNVEDFNQAATNYQLSYRNSLPSIYGNEDGLQSGEYNFVIHQRLPDTNETFEDINSAFSNYMNYFLNHQSWDTPGQIEIIEAQDISQIPEEYRSYVLHE